MGSMLMLRLAIAIMIALTTACTPNGGGRQSQPPLEYLNNALDWIEAHAILRDPATWSEVRQQALALATEPHSTADTYLAIEFAVQRLHDPNALFTEPGPPTRSPANPGLHVVYPEDIVAVVEEGGPADRAGVRVGDVIASVNGVAPRPNDTPGQVDLGPGPEFHLALQRPGLAEPMIVDFQADRFELHAKPTGRRVTTPRSGLAYIELPWDPGNPEYPTLAQSVLRGVDQAPTCGWIIDLRRNVGGDLWSYLAAIGPIVGQGDVGGFAYPSGDQDVWTYRGGKVYWNDKERFESFVDGPIYALKRETPPVALLTSRLTAAAGELVLIAFGGRAEVRSFGEPTAGSPYLFYQTFLSDGARIGVSGALSFDRTGRVYHGPSVPDEPVRTNWSTFGTDNDPAVQAAVAWLTMQPGCEK